MNDERLTYLNELYSFLDEEVSEVATRLESLVVKMERLAPHVRDLVPFPRGNGNPLETALGLIQDLLGVRAEVIQVRRNVLKSYDFKPGMIVTNTVPLKGELVRTIYRLNPNHNYFNSVSIHPWTEFVILDRRGNDYVMTPKRADLAFDYPLLSIEVGRMGSFFKPSERTETVPRYRLEFLMNGIDYEIAAKFVKLKLWTTRPCPEWSGNPNYYDAHPDLETNRILIENDPLMGIVGYAYLDVGFDPNTIRDVVFTNGGLFRDRIRVGYRRRDDVRFRYNGKISTFNSDLRPSDVFTNGLKDRTLNFLDLVNLYDVPA